MGSDWPKIQLSEAGVTLVDCDHKTPRFVPDGLPYLTIPQMKGGRLLLSESRKISGADFVHWTRKACPKPYDVVLSRRCNPGETGHVEPGMKFALGQNLVLLRADGGAVRPAFLRWLTRSPQWFAEVQRFLNVGAVFDSLRCADILKFEFNVPPPEIQSAIAEMLGSFDDKIELNRKIAKTLEEMAQALFRSWFVDFDPVIDNALAAGNPIPPEFEARAARRQESRARAQAEGRLFGLPEDQAKQFPDRFEDSELGPIPGGWHVKGLDETAKFLNGLAMQKFPAGDGASLPVIKISQLRRGTTEGADMASSCIPEDYIVRDGDLLFSWSGSLDCIFWCGGTGGLNQHLFKVTSTTFPIWFIYQCIQLHLNTFRAIAAGKATTMGHIQRHHLADAKVVVPNPELLAYADVCHSVIVQKMVCLNIQSRTVSQVRDALLPKLISGEIQVDGQVH